MPKSEHRVEARAALINRLSPTQIESGCYESRRHQDLDGEPLSLNEKWKNQAVLDTHDAIPYYKAEQRLLTTLLGYFEIIGNFSEKKSL